MSLKVSKFLSGKIVSKYIELVYTETTKLSNNGQRDVISFGGPTCGGHSCGIPCV